MGVPQDLAALEDKVAALTLRVTAVELVASTNAAAIDRARKYLGEKPL